MNAGMIEAADFHIGRLLDHLEATGQLENTSRLREARRDIARIKTIAAQKRDAKK